MRNLVLIVGLGVAVAGCNKGPTTEETARATGDIRLENVSAEEVMKQAAAAQDKNKIQPGEWENTLQILAVEMPGAPEALRKQIEAEAKKPPETKKECKKAEDAKAIDFSQMGAVTKGCTFSKYVQANGKIDADMACNGPFGPVSMQIAGTQTATAYDVTMTQLQTAPGASAQSKLTVRASGKRLGECKS
ncbi:MAG: DUF3617 domain-containing protein [Sphingomonadales bacterium]|nr:MAG: DUF3617 domain-containing protein [Sphingomonadales bacterium]